MSRRSAAVAMLVLLGAVALFWVAFGRPAPTVPSFEATRAAYRPSDARLFDRHGELIHEVRIDESARRLAWTGLEEISPALQAAVIASEDRRFYEHGGVDGRALAAAALRRMIGGPSRGASTISMQLGALVDPRLRRREGSRTPAQKWRQMRVAWAIERRWSKVEILEAYLNLVTFRGELQGVAAASSVLFGKAPHGLSEAEAAVLAALLRSPNAQHAAVTRRAARVLEAQGKQVRHEEVEAAARTALDVPEGPGPRVALAPHAARRLVRVASAHSTLDARLQRLATDTLRRHLLAVRDQRVEDGAILVAANRTGEILAYVGGSGELSSAWHVDGVQARRQAGSALKPFLYGLAMERRLITPASLLEDAPLDLPVAGGVYRPRNYDEQFKGLVTARTALAASLNVPAVRTLNLVGPEAVVQHLRRLGFEGLVESGDYYGPSIAVGSADVSLWELVNAYRTLASGGVWRPLRLVPEGETAEMGRQIYTNATTFLVSHILADRESRSVTFGLENPLSTRFWSAVKTGTSKEMRDNWCVGYSRDYTVGVWVGNFSGEPMRNVSGITGAAPIWLEIMDWLHRAMPSRPPDPPAGLAAAAVSFPRQVEPDRVEWFLNGTEPGPAATTLAFGHPRITTPVSGTIVALDPDIPASRQRLLFEARAGSAPVRWLLDGSVIGSATEHLFWDPRPGRHVLALIDDAERPLDTVTFEVRGVTAPSSD